MKKNIKFYNLIREMYRIERDFLANVKWEKLDMGWTQPISIEESERIATKNLSVEEKLEFERVRERRRENWRKFKEILPPEEYEKWIVESLSPIHQQAVGSVVLGENPKSMIDNLPVIYSVLGNHLPIDEGTKIEKYRVEVNDVEWTLSYDCYIVMEHIRKLKPHQQKRFHFKNLLYDLEINQDIHKDHSGKPNTLFRQRPEIFKILFTPPQPKCEQGYWMCNVDYWGD